MVHYLECNSFILDSQHGFRNNKSCLSNVLTFYDVSKSFDVIYLDFQKAFDNVHHYKFLHKIKDIGIKGRLYEWIKQWLNNR